MNPSMIAIGQCCKAHGELLKIFIRRSVGPIVVSEPTVTETVKLTQNSYLSTLISFWNEIDKVTRALGVSTKGGGGYCQT